MTETLILYLIAKFAIAASFLILYPFAGELYPTEIRGIGIGFTAYLGGLGLVAIPFVNYLVIWSILFQTDHHALIISFLFFVQTIKGF